MTWAPVSQPRPAPRRLGSRRARRRSDRGSAATDRGAGATGVAAGPGVPARAGPARGATSDGPDMTDADPQCHDRGRRGLFPGPGVRPPHRPQRLGQLPAAGRGQVRPHPRHVRRSRRQGDVLHAGLGRGTPSRPDPPHRRRRPRTGQPWLGSHARRFTQDAGHVPRRCPPHARCCWRISAASR